MKKYLLMATIFLMGMSVWAGDGAAKPAAQPEQQAATSASTPMKFSIWPDNIQWPTGLNTYGMELGLPISFDTKNTFVAGLDVALACSESNVKGVQISILNKNAKSDGVQIAIAHLVELFCGVEIGVYNEYKDSAGLQIGLINKGTNSKSVQIGLINILDNGFCSIFPFVNFSNK